MTDVNTASLNASGSFAGPASIRFYVVAFAVEVVLLVAFVATYSYGMWIFFVRGHPQTRRQQSNVLLMVANTAMILMSLVHLALDIHIAQLGFVHTQPAFEEAKFMLYVTQTLIGDGFMIYRVYRVHGRNWPVIVAPSVLLVADAVIGYASTFLGAVGFYMSVGFYALSLCVNLICTALIMWRVYYLTREFQHLHRRKSKLKLWKVVETSVQSTAIYSAAAVSLVITFVNSTEVGYPTCLNVFPALIGLVFSFIVIRVALNSTKDDVRPDSRFHVSSTGRTTFGSTAPMVDNSDRTPTRQVFASDTLSTAHVRRAVSNEVLVISEIKTESEVSLPLPHLNEERKEASEMEV